MRYFNSSATSCTRLRIRPESRIRGLASRLAESIFMRLSSRRQRSIVRLMLRRFWRLQDAIVRLASLADDGKYVKRRFTWSMQAFFCARMEPGWRLLDAGCGAGELTRELARTAGEIIACDVLPPSRFIAKDLANVQYMQIDIEQSLPEGRFDVVILSSVLSLLKYPGFLLDRLRERTGRLLVRETKFDYHVMPLLGQEFNEPGTCYQLWTKAELVALLDTHGWTVTEEWDSYDLFFACQRKNAD